MNLILIISHFDRISYAALNNKNIINSLNNNFMSFFSSSDTGQKRRLALLHAVLLIFKSDSNPSFSIKMEQESFIRTLSMGLSDNSLFIPKAESMSDVEMASILRNCSNFYKKSYAQTLSSAMRATSSSEEVRDTLLKIAKECDIPMNYFV